MKIQTFSFKKMHLKTSSVKRRPFCLGPNVLSNLPYSIHDFPDTAIPRAVLITVSEIVSKITQIVSEKEKNVCTWWRHQMETFSVLLAFCAGNSEVTGEFPSQRLVTRSLDVFFDLRLCKRLSRQSWGRWFETSSCSLLRHCNELTCSTAHKICTVFVGSI